MKFFHLVNEQRCQQYHPCSTPYMPSVCSCPSSTTITDQFQLLYVCTAVRPGQQSAQKSSGRTLLPRIESVGSRTTQDAPGPLRLELNGGAQRRTVELPTAPLDGQRRYQVSFSVRPADPAGGGGGSSGGGGGGGSGGGKRRERRHSVEERSGTLSPPAEIVGQQHTHALSL